MVASKRSSEIRLLFALLLFIAFFTFWIIPNSVEDPEGFGYAQGLPPSFSVYLIAFLAAFTLLLRLIKVFRSTNEDGRLFELAQMDSQDMEEASESRSRSAAILVCCLLYGFLFVPYLGFYISSFGFVIFLSALLAERRPVVLILLPILLVAGIYVAFEKGFTIFLPRGELILQLYETMDW